MIPITEFVYTKGVKKKEALGNKGIEYLINP